MPPTTTSEPMTTRTTPVYVVPSDAHSGEPDGEAGRIRAGSVLMEWVEPSPGIGRRTQIGIEFDGCQLIAIGVRRDGRRQVVSCLLSAMTADTPTPEELAGRLRALAGGTRPGVHLVLTTARAIVRHLLLPPVPARQRRSAALWEGQKLIPFPLNDQEAIYGMDFVSAGASGWHVTLAAVPRQDAAPIMGAIDRLGWKLRSVSLAGTQRFHELASVQPEVKDRAVVVWSARRGAFSIFRDGQLTFHCDLGPMPTTPVSAGDASEARRADDLRQWISAMGSAIGDALDFHLNIDPNRAPGHLTVIGLPAAAAPLLTDWQSRFDAGVTILDPIDALGPSLPQGIADWLHANSGEVAPALSAAAYGVAVDLTPPTIRRSQHGQGLKQLVRGLCLTSLFGTALWSGLLWAHMHNAHRAQELAQSGLAALDGSPVARDFAATRETLAQRRTMLAAVQAPLAWMPWIKTVLATRPANGRLTNVTVFADSLDSRAPGATLTLRLEGTLSPDGPPHALTYRQWADRLERLCGPGRVRLLNERTIDWQGQRRWAFTIELRPLVKSVIGGKA